MTDQEYKDWWLEFDPMDKGGAVWFCKDPRNADLLQTLTMVQHIHRRPVTEVMLNEALPAIKWAYDWWQKQQVKAHPW